MSLTSEYYEAKRKRKKQEEEDSLTKKTSTGSSLTDEYLSAREERGDYTYPDEDIAPVIRYDASEEKEEQREAFDGGYQFGDLTRLINKYTSKWGITSDENNWTDGYDVGDVTKTILGTAGDAVVSAVEGGVGLLEGITDLAQYGIAGIYDLAGDEIHATKAKANAKRNDTINLGNDIRDALGIDDTSMLGSTSQDLARALGQIGAIVGTGGIAGAAGATGAGVTATTSTVTGLSAWGSGMGEAYQGGASDEEAFVYGLASGLFEAGIELLSGGLGKGVEAIGLSKGIGGIDDKIASAFTKNIKNKFAKTAAQWGIKASGEGLEEVASGLSSAFLKKLTYMKEEDLGKLIENEDLLKQFVIGTLASGIAQTPDVKSSVSTGADFVTGLTADEQKTVDNEYNKRLRDAAQKGKELSTKEKNNLYNAIVENVKEGIIIPFNENENAVVDKIYNDRVAEEEKDGKKLTGAEKNKIYDSVLNELDKGYISTDTIESVLGGDEYKSYTDTIAKEDALRKELDELRNMKSGDMTDIQKDRLTELKEMDLSDTNRNNLRTSLNEKMFGIVKGSKLAESYNERARRGQAFEADLSGYNEKQAAIVQKAIDSGILNNTNRTHDFVDMVAKISADKGVLFDFANNEKLKESGFAIEGKTINGFVTKDGVTLNIDSAKSLNSVVGHEITHVLEGTELYAELQKAITEYAKSKGDYQGRRDSLTNLYKGVKDANIDAELTADLVGDYLFTDKDFVMNLSTKHRNVFQKIYDEIKYLYKMATAGSKEARQLEKVKHTFDKVYKESGKASGDTKYSLGYHAGDLGKAESYGEQGYYRGTGHFGTGTYFVGDEAKISDSHYGKRPHHSVEFDNYNLYKIRNDNDGSKLHKSLKAIDGGVTQEFVDAAKDDKFRVSELRHEANERTKNYEVEEYDEDLGFSVSSNYTEASIQAYTEVANENEIEIQSYDEWLAEQSDEVPAQGDPDYEYYKTEYVEYLRDSIEEFDNERNNGYEPFRDAYFDLWLRFGKERVNNALQAVIEYDAKMEQSDYNTQMRSDSRATVFMKALGYEGIDTRGTALDNTEYGSVIYDLKGDDLAKKNAIGTAKFSISDSDGKKLTNEQNEYFKDSKMRDEDGNLKVMYHGSQDAGFHIFDPSHSDDGISLFFVDRNDVATSYSGTSETYEAQTIHTAEDMNNFIKSIGVEGYEVLEHDGKFDLIYEEDLIASRDTAKEIYEEFCWYEGVGDGDANYKVYLNLTNPLVVDAEGRPWNKIDAEFSQEVYDKYNSLTDEEKAALVDLAEWEDFNVFNSEIQEARGDALASAYAKMGEDCNIYDLFSVAADNFSEEAMRENARGYLKTRDYAQRAKKGGYDGVIIKNVHDNGGYSNGSEGASTVAIAFNSEQVKSVANEKPTGDPDIRYSLSPETDKAYLDAVNKGDTETAQSIVDEAAEKAMPNSKVRDANGNLRLVYHGRVSNFNVFDRKFSQIEGDFGKGFYFTSNEYDVDANYANEEGPDLKNKIARYAERLEYEDGYEDLSYEEREQIARDKFITSDANTVTAYLNMENPVYITPNTKGTFLDFDEAYDEEFDEYGEASGLFVDFVEALKENAADYAYGDVDFDFLYEYVYDDGGMYAADVVSVLKRNDRFIDSLSDENGDLALNEVIRKAFEDIGFDGIIDSTVYYKFGNMNGMDSGTTHYIVFNSNQIKSADAVTYDDNGNVIPLSQRFNANSDDIRYSLSAEGETPNNRGWNMRGEDVALAPMQEDISKVENTTEEAAPVTEKISATSSKMEQVAPTVDEAVDYSVDEEEAPSMREIYGEEYAPAENSYTVEQEIDNIRNEARAVYEEYDRLVNEGKEAEADPLFDKFIELTARGQDLQNKAEALKAEERGYFDSLTDADAPPEVEAPYSESSIIDPFEERNISDVGNRKVNAYMYENPEVKPFFQEEANIMLGELRDTQKGERFYVPTPDGQPGVYGAESYGIWQGTSRHTSPDIEYLLDTLKMSYADIEKGLNAIIEDNGAENIAAAKRIEFILNDRLLNGYQDISGYDVPANQDYRNLIKEKGVTAYNEEAKRAFYKSLDEMDIAPIAPTYDTASEKQIPGQQTIFEDKKAESAPTVETAPEPAPTEEPKVAKVLESTPKEPKKVSFWQKVRNLVFDKQSVIEDISLKSHNRELMGKADFMLRSESRAQRHIKNKLLPLVERIEKTGNRQAYEEYAYHLHNIDRMSLESKAQARMKELEGKFGRLLPEQIKAIAATKITEKTTEKTAKTIGEAKEWLDLLEVKNKPVFGDTVTADVSREAVKAFEATHKDAKEIAEAITEYNNELRQMLVDAGIISKETADLWAEMYPHYVPIRRAGKNGAAVKVPLDSMRTGINAPIARATGGNSDIESLLDTMGSRTEQVYRAVARNSFGVELMHTIDTVTDTEPTSIEEILDSFENKTDELLKAGENGANPTFTVFEDGKRITFDITEEMYDALKPMNEAFKADIPVMSFLTKLQRGILTQYNPTFIATNAAKDIQDVLVNSQHAAKTYANVPLAIKELFSGKGKWITEYMDNGGEDLTYFDSKKQVFKKDSTVKKVLGFVPNGIAKANDFVEKIPRLAEYIASRKKGASVEVSMLDAARVTTNFAAGGDLTKFANRNGFTFLNASIQGFNQQVRNIREAKANGLKGVMQLAAKFAIAGLPIMLFNAIRWEDDEDYEELSDYVKDNYYIVAKYGDGKFVRIPKGRAVAVIQSAFEQMKNLITGDDEVDMARFGQLMVNNLAPNNPLDNNVLAPIAQAVTNKTWYGGDLVPQRLQDLPDAEQFDETTDSISKWLGEITGQSPYKINYLLDQYSGGIGDVVLPMLTPESDKGGIIAPFMDKFTTDSVMKNQNVSDFYTTVDELTKNANSMHATDEDILKSKYMNSVSSELGELYQQKREIQNSKLTDSEKNELVREIQKEIDRIAKESLDTYGDVDIDGVYAQVGDRHFRWYEPGEDSEAEPGWQKLTDKQLEKQNEVTKGLGISAGEYWSNKEEYDFAYESPDRYAVAKSVGGYKAFKTYSSELYDIKADKDENGKSISGSRKEKVIEYVNNLDVDYGIRLILFKSEYNADDTYNYDIIDYLNSRDDISYEDTVTILKELGFTVDSKGNIYWD